jgi:glycosyltransferase involved in cell wall biosynthesis
LYIGYKGKQIKFVSDTQGEGYECQVLKWDAPEGLTTVDIIQDYEVWRGKVVEKSEPKPIQQLRIAFVGVWKIQCGISTYAEELFPRMGAQVKDWKIFAEHSDTAVIEEGVERCWTRGEPLTELIANINAFAPDVVYIEHEFGIFPNARHWLSFMAQMQKYKVFVKQHSIFYHKDKLICESAVPNIIVHSDIGKKVLEEKGVSSNINVIKHGCFPCKNEKRHWNLYHSEHTLVQFGFGFEYKGWEVALEAVSVLKEKFPKIFFTGLFSESKFNKLFHTNYYNRLSDLIKKLDVEEHVALIRGYQTDEALDAYLRTNQVAVFPYVLNGEHTVYGATGAARLAMAAGTPTITSFVPQFDDVDGVCPRPSDAKELAYEIERFFLSKEVRDEQIKRQNQFLIDNSWDAVTQQHLELFCQGEE